SHGGQVRDGIALEITVVDPDGIEAELLGPPRPDGGLVDVASGGQPDADPASQLSHEITVLHSSIGRNRDTAVGGYNRERGAAGAGGTDPADVRPGGGRLRRSQPVLQCRPRPRLAPPSSPARRAPSGSNR